jgi:hypothetical protein
LNKTDRALLAKKLANAFPRNHLCYLYFASISSVGLEPVIEPIELAKLAGHTIKAGFILFIPAESTPDIDKDLAKRFSARRPK